MDLITSLTILGYMRSIKEKSALIEFGQRLKKIRAGKNLSQEKLALKTGLDRTYVSACERGQRNPSLISICKLAQGLEVNVNELFLNNLTVS